MTMPVDDDCRSIEPQRPYDTFLFRSAACPGDETALAIDDKGVRVAHNARSAGCDTNPGEFPPFRTRLQARRKVAAVWRVLL